MPVWTTLGLSCNSFGGISGLTTQCFVHTNSGQFDGHFGAKFADIWIPIVAIQNVVRSAATYSVSNSEAKQLNLGHPGALCWTTFGLSWYSVVFAGISRLPITPTKCGG